MTKRSGEEMQDLIDKRVEELAAELLNKDWTVTAAESCTGGGVAASFTALPGSSAWFEAGFVTYSNRIKTLVLGVEEQVLLEHGAVSEAVVKQMAAGALRASGADISVAISGIAGPGGATETKPVGMVCFACGLSGLPDNASVSAKTAYFDGDRDQVRRQAVLAAIEMLLENLRR